jgi:hypothetical protein
MPSSVESRPAMLVFPVAGRPLTMMSSGEEDASTMRGL